MFQVKNNLIDLIVALVFVTGDRLLYIRYNTKYTAYWNIDRVWRLLVVSWSCALSIGIAFSLLMYFKYDYVRFEARINRAMTVYALSVLNTIYLVFAVVSYVIMFLHYSASQRRTHIGHSGGFFKAFRRSKFFIPVVIVTSSLCLVVLPSLARKSHFILGYKTPYELTFFYLVALRLSYTVDGIIYSLLQRPVRNLLWNIIRNRSCNTMRMSRSTNNTKNSTMEMMSCNKKNLIDSV